MPSVVVDTHAAVWYLLNSPRLSVPAFSAIAASIQAGTPVYLPSISIVELVYLVEKGRIAQAVLDQLSKALTTSGFGFSLYPLDLGVAETLKQIPRSSVPDMPDRIIAATAAYLGLPLVTRDMKIQTANLQTIW